MRYLGVDYGTKKIGLALSDESGRLAFPRETIPNNEQVFDAITQLLSGEQVGGVVIGHSLSHTGEENPVMKGAHALAEYLKEKEVDVHLEPEFYTTAQARRSSEDAVADSAAAALILQSFLDKQTTAD